MNELREGFVPEEAKPQPIEARGEKMTRERFEAEVHANYQAFLRYTLSLLANKPEQRNDVEEIVQVACLKAYRHLDEFRGDATFKTYVMTIIRNDIFRLLGNAGRREKYFGKRDRAQQNRDARDPLESKVGREPSGFDYLVKADLEKIIRGLPTIYRDVILTEAHEPELLIRDKAKKLGIGEGAYKTRLRRARDMLKERGYPSK